MWEEELGTCKKNREKNEVVRIIGVEHDRGWEEKNEGRRM
jgi:hypothetical protein